MPIPNIRPIANVKYHNQTNIQYQISDQLPIPNIITGQVENYDFNIVLLLRRSFHRRLLSRPRPRRGTDLPAGFQIKEYFLVSLNSKVLEDVKTEYGMTTDLPVVPFIVVVGFMLVLIIEQTVLHFQVGRICCIISSSLKNGDNLYRTRNMNLRMHSSWLMLVRR